jgi:hypothetical protein
MQITITRTGGFAGVRQRLGPVETASLDSGIADQASRIVTEVDFFHLPQSMQGAPVYDGFHYAIQVSDGPVEHTVSLGGMSDDPAAARLHELIELLDEAVGFVWM